MADSVVELPKLAELPVTATAAKLDTAPAPLTAGGRRAVAGLVRTARRLVRTHAFRLASLYFLVFAASVVGVLFFVYWTSAKPKRRSTPRLPGSPSSTPSAASAGSSRSSRRVAPAIAATACFTW